jgi:hypothetical protein
VQILLFLQASLLQNCEETGILELHRDAKQHRDLLQALDSWVNDE